MAHRWLIRQKKKEGATPDYETTDFLICNPLL
jgi:hypothetical protein